MIPITTAANQDLMAAGRCFPVKNNTKNVIKGMKNIARASLDIPSGEIV